jgi:phosphate transport system protein
MTRLLDSGLEKLTTILFKMGGIAEEAVNLSVESFLQGTDTSEKVRSLSDLLVTLGTDAEDTVFELIAKHQPVASDLRILKSYMKASYDLERYGRYAWDISFTQKKLADSEESSEDTHPPSLRKMAERVAEMVHISIGALRSHDPELAKQLTELEREVDGVYLKFLEKLGRETSITKAYVSNILVTRYLERIADHAIYIGESVVYIATGKRAILR